MSIDLGEGVKLIDISDELPRNRRPKRDPNGIVRCYHHHSGALGRGGKRGAIATSRYVVQHRGFPGPAYTFWLPYDQPVVYRLNKDEDLSWHTGGVNEESISVAWQGNLRKIPPTAYQYHSARMLCRWIREHYNLSNNKPFSFHAEAHRFGGRSKSRCPGAFVENWVNKELYQT